MSTANGSNSPTVSPTETSVAQVEAGPVRPCSAKSMSSSASAGRNARTVYVRITTRSSAGIASQAGYQSPDGSTSSVRPGGGRKSLIRWSGPAVTAPASRGPVKVIRRRCGLRSRTAVTITEAESNAIGRSRTAVMAGEPFDDQEGTASGWT